VPVRCPVDHDQSHRARGQGPWQPGGGCSAGQMPFISGSGGSGGRGAAPFGRRRRGKRLHPAAWQGGVQSTRKRRSSASRRPTARHSSGKRFDITSFRIRRRPLMSGQASVNVSGCTSVDFSSTISINALKIRTSGDIAAAYSIMSDKANLLDTIERPRVGRFVCYLVEKSAAIGLARRMSYQPATLSDDLSSLPQLPA
jgi:hypothetical protein